MRGSGNHVDIVKRFESEKEAALGTSFKGGGEVLTLLRKQ